MAQTDQECGCYLEVSKFRDFHSIDYDGSQDATVDNDFTLKTTATDLMPDTQYFYRWRVVFNPPSVFSDVGTFKTAPSETQAVNVKFSWSGDTDSSPTKLDPNPFFGNWDALRAAQSENPNFFIYLGDTIYSDMRAAGSGHSPSPAKTLPEFRQLYKDARGFALLQSLLRSTSIYALWDDHEVQNDWSGQTIDRNIYRIGKQAFNEYMPITEYQGEPSDPYCAGSPDPTQFRVKHWGKNIDLIMLDTRSCRSDNAQKICGGNNPDPAPMLPDTDRATFGLKPTDPKCRAAILDPNRIMLGQKQLKTFTDALEHSTAKFKFVVSSVNMQQTLVLPYDSWEGYAAERSKILNFIYQKGIKNVIFLSTDSHLNLMGGVYARTPTGLVKVADEFVTGPIGARTDKVFLESLPKSICKISCLAAKEAILTSVGVGCRNLDTYSYGSVVYTEPTGSLTITLKDKNGNVVKDDLKPSVTCTKTFP